jgi:hypothetical protein
LHQKLAAKEGAKVIYEIKKAKKPSIVIAGVNTMIETSMVSSLSMDLS